MLRKKKKAKGNQITPLISMLSEKFEEASREQEESNTRLLGMHAATLAKLNELLSEIPKPQRDGSKSDQDSQRAGTSRSDTTNGSNLLNVSEGTEESD